jgi:phytoene dehydrogenase-like protein
MNGPAAVQPVAAGPGRRGLPARCSVAVLGGGMAGMATALRLQTAGLGTVVFEAHGHAGGCAGYFRHRGFSFDVGATTLVDFEPGGVGGELVDAVGLPGLDGEPLPGYLAWLPDRTVTLHRDQAAWHQERLRALGGSERHRAFWALLDRLAGAFWTASRCGVRLPVRRPTDAVHDLRAVGVRQLWLGRYLGWTLGDALGRFGLREEAALAGLLGMLVEDTVHSTVDSAPLINAALGITIRGAGLTRHRGGMRGFWRRLVAHYRLLGGDLRTGCQVLRVTGGPGAYQVHTARGTVEASQVVSALPAATTARITESTPLARWVYPLLTVYLPHHAYGDTPLTQTRTLRGRVLPALFLELTYHLEHHLYPQVPSHHLAELARRLDPYLTAAGVRPRQVI